MILAIETGNSNIKIGVISDDGIIVNDRVRTDRGKMEIEYAIIIRSILRINGIAPDEIRGAIISSNVPEITETLKRAVIKLTGKTPLIVGPGIKTGVSINIDNPAQLGADLLVGAVASIKEMPLPLITIDLGTSTTLFVVNTKGQIIGGIIAPGVRTALDSLVSKASLLQQISIEEPRKSIGSNTIDCLKSGALYGNAAMIDGLIEKIEEELGERCNLIATGGLAKLIIPYCKRKDIKLDDDLLMKGLKIIYEKNNG